MTFFIIFIATVNLAIGYALAVYLGHGQLPWRVGALTLPRSATNPTATEPVDDLPSESLEQAEALEPNLPDEELVEEAKPEVSAEVDPPAAEQPPSEEASAIEENETAQSQDAVGEQADHAETPEAESVEEVAQAEEELEVPAEEPIAPEEVEATTPAPTASVEEVVKPVPEEASQEATEDDPLPAHSEEAAGTDGPIAEQREQQPEISTPVENDPVATTAPAEASELQEATSEQDVAEEEEGEVNEQFLDGIATFQNQLEQPEQEESTEDLAAEATNDQPTTSQESPEEEDVLAGIEAFRAQLASIQQESASTTEEESAEETTEELVR